MGLVAVVATGTPKTIDQFTAIANFIIDGYDAYTFTGYAQRHD